MAVIILLQHQGSPSEHFSSLRLRDAPLPCSSCGTGRVSLFQQCPQHRAQRGLLPEVQRHWHQGVPQVPWPLSALEIPGEERTQRLQGQY